MGRRLPVAAHRQAHQRRQVGGSKHPLDVVAFAPLLAVQPCVGIDEPGGQRSQVVVPGERSGDLVGRVDVDRRLLRRPRERETSVEDAIELAAFVGGLAQRRPQRLAQHISIGQTDRPCRLDRIDGLGQRHAESVCLQLPAQKDDPVGDSAHVTGEPAPRRCSPLS